MSDEDYLCFFEERLEKLSDADVERLWNVLELASGMEVLDLGCGHGRIANRLARRDCRVVGMDISHVFLERAREVSNVWCVPSTTFVMTCKPYDRRN